MEIDEQSTVEILHFRDGVDLFRRLADDIQAAIVMVTHDNKILDSADRIVHLDDGRLVEGS